MWKEKHKTYADNKVEEDVKENETIETDILIVRALEQTESKERLCPTANEVEAPSAYIVPYLQQAGTTYFLIRRQVHQIRLLSWPISSYI